ncbi:MAG: ATP-binding protein [Chlamydiae bacterium]|nr:ATP-binding protein [Chlamydiota bacterium]MBI3276522.1 ATP-binding protein [Chlamydiota bacterium]
MSFIAGPRQIGKTTAVQRFLKEEGQDHLYYNWDTATVKRKYIANPLFFIEDIPSDHNQSWVAFDEIHKYPKWKNLLKGYYDEWHEKTQFIVTGSARLDLFRRSGDSLVGRYFLFKMLPLGVREIVSNPRSSPNPEWTPKDASPIFPEANRDFGEALDHLIHLTGYPEPLSVGTEEFYTRWRDQHISLILHEDLRDLTKITQIQKLETLLYLLPERIGAPLSLNSLVTPLEVAHGSIRSWLEAMKRVYLIFSIKPWTARLSRSILREEKYYFWDWGMADKVGAKFENFVAVQLQRAISCWNEKGKGNFQLHYIRTKEGQEIDFAITNKNKVVLLIEAKENETSLSKSLPYFQEKVQSDLAIQVVNKRNIYIQKGKGLYIVGADRLFSLLP